MRNTAQHCLKLKKNVWQTFGPKHIIFIHTRYNNKHLYRELIINPKWKCILKNSAFRWKKKQTKKNYCRKKNWIKSKTSEVTHSAWSSNVAKQKTIERNKKMKNKNKMYALAALCYSLIIFSYINK